MTTIVLVPVDGGRKTKSLAYFGLGQGGSFLGRFVTNIFCRFFLRKTVEKGCQALGEALKQDLANGLAVDSEAEGARVEISPEEVRAAVGSSLTS